jgi:aspartate/methionine/tyrosine aminotransferase
VSKERFVLGWEGGSEDSFDIRDVLSDRVRSVIESPHGMWNYMTYRDAIGILGLDAGEIYREGRIDLDPKEWADFGWMSCYAGPPKSAVKEMKSRTNASNINPYSPDLINPLREACALLKFKRSRGEEFEVIGTEGGQAGISYFLQTILNPGDEVIITDPGYFHFESAILMARGVPVRIPLNSKNGFCLDPDEIKDCITPRTKVLIICDPVNPFGTIQSRESLLDLIELANKSNMFILNDITHNTHQIDPTVEHYAMSSLWRETNVNKVVSVFSVSHGYGMAGVRIGFLAGHPELMRACLITKVSLTRINTNLIAQYGALAALRDDDYIEKSEKIIRRNYSYIKSIISGTKGLSLPVEPKYGFSMVLDVSGTDISAQELTVALFKHHIAVYPGDGLGDNGATEYIRLNISRPDLWALRHFRKHLPIAISEAQAGLYREHVISLFEQKATKRARWILQKLKERERGFRVAF